MEFDSRLAAKKRVFIAVITIIILLGIAVVVFEVYVDNLTRSVTLDNNGFESELKTMENSVGCLLNKYGIVLEQGDEVYPGKDELLKNDLRITVRRAMEVTVSADGIEHRVYSLGGTVEDALTKAGIELSKFDELNLNLETLITPGMNMVVARITKETLIDKEAIPYQVIVRNDNTQVQGQRRVVQNGEQGELQKEYEIVYRDGIEISREFKRESITQNPVDHIVMAGTLGSKLTSRGDAVRYAFSRVFEVTAYTHTGNPTRTGVMPKIGHVAVDPRIIPLNSKIYIDFSGRWNHLDGFYKATDTGGVIIGDIVDIFMDTEEEAVRFGRRRARVYLVR